MRHCENELKPGTESDNLLSLLLLSYDLSNKHCSHFIRSDACNNSSLQASPGQKVGLRGNNCCCLSLLMWLPYAVYIFLIFQSSIMKFLSFQEVIRLEFSLIILFLMNSLVNPIVYAIRMPEFRKALLVLFKLQRRQNARDIPLHAL